MPTRRLLAALAAATLALPLALHAIAQSPPQDALTDPALKGPEVLAFMKIAPGDKVADIVSGRFLRALSRAVGPTGRVYAVEPAEVIAVHPDVTTRIKAFAASPEGANVELVTGPVDGLPLPRGLSAVLIRQNYHDLHDKFMGPADVAKVNRTIFDALKPGGLYVVLDHAAAPGSGLRDTNTLHRIDPAAVRAEVEAAGFVFDGESPIFRNPDDDHTKRVFDPTIRGRTDQFLMRFRKPA